MHDSFSSLYNCQAPGIRNMNPQAGTIHSADYDNHHCAGYQDERQAPHGIRQGRHGQPEGERGVCVGGGGYPRITIHNNRKVMMPTNPRWLGG
jgi:hypothetical protein